MGDTESDPNSHLKDSCSYSVETAKQFLTFGAGGLAFVVGLALTPDFKTSDCVFWAFAVFTLSIVLGLLYIMSVVGHISKKKNYNVYTPWLRWVCGLQILAVVAGVICLGSIVLSTLRSRHAPGLTTGDFQLTAAGHTVRYPVPGGAVVAVEISQSGEVHLRIEKSAAVKAP